MNSNLKKGLYIGGSILVIGIVAFYGIEWIRIAGKRKVEDRGIDVYIDDDIDEDDVEEVLP
jgi:hypothetical protein